MLSIRINKPMRRQFLIIIGSIFLTTLVAGQSVVEKFAFHSSVEKKVISSYTHGAQEDLALYLIADESLTESQLDSHQKLIALWTDEFSQKQRKVKNNNRFLSHLFYKVHRKLLKNYVPFTSFHNTLNSGDYDCLSATTLYALILSNLDIEFEIVETNYHIYLKMVDEQEKVVLFESTDPLNGFIDNEAEVNNRLAEYTADNQRSRPVQGEYAYSADMNNSVGMTRLVGLHYYNAAVKTFNNGEITKAVPLFQKALLFHDSERLNEFGYVLSQALLMADQLTKETKRNLMGRLSNGENIVSTY